MNYKPDEATLVSYLYGELSGEELHRVEEYLQKNPDERKRLEEWSFTRSALSSLADKEVIAPPIFLEGSPRTIPFWKESYFRLPLGIAASFLFMIVTAKIMGLSLRYSGNELRIGFGATESKQEVPAVTREQVGEMINQSLQQNNHVLQASWNEDRAMLQQSIQKNLASASGKIDKLVKTASSANQEQVKRFVNQMQNENLKLMKDYMQLSATGQKEYIESLLVDFSKYLQEQRKQDIQLFQAKVNSVESNTNQFKQETEQILTSLIANTGNTNQRRN